jgi:hypothetical protein
MTARSLSIFALLALAPLGSARAQAGHDHAAMHPAGDSAYKAMKDRGTTVMRVDQDRSTHRFTDLADGGQIELTSNVEDSAATARIRKHFGDIEKAFAAGDFSIAVMVHDQTIPGTEVMKAKAAEISYRMLETPRGARLRITTGDPAAIAAIHRFLLFQRTEHHAGQ